MSGVVRHAKAQQFRHLLRDRGPACAGKRPAPFGQVRANCAGNPARRYAEMAIEAPVLGRDDGVFQMRADRAGGDDAAEGLAPPGENLAVAVHHGDGPLRAVIQQVGEGGKVE